MGVAIPAGQLTLVGGRRVLVDPAGRVASIVDEAVLLDELDLVQRGGREVVIGRAGTSILRFEDPLGPGLRIAVVAAPNFGFKSVEVHGALLRFTYEHVVRRDLWLTSEGLKVDAPAAPPSSSVVPKPSAASGSPLLSWLSRETRSPLVAAVASGIRSGPERALVASGTQLFEVDLTTGLPIAMRDLGPGIEARTLVSVRGQPGVLALVGEGNPEGASRSRSSGSVQILRTPNTSAWAVGDLTVEELPKPAGSAMGPWLSSSGGVLWFGPCQSNDEVPRLLAEGGWPPDVLMSLLPVCVRQPDGALKSRLAPRFVQPGHLVPSVDGGAAMLGGTRDPQGRRSSALTRVDAEGRLSTVEIDQGEVALLGSLDEVRAGVFVGFVQWWPERTSETDGKRPEEHRGFLRIEGARATVTPFEKRRRAAETMTALRSGRAVYTAGDAYRVSGDAGLTWTSLPRPPAAWEARLEVGELGLVEGGLVRLGWSAELDGGMPAPPPAPPPVTVVP
jgi:hypothetical protein